MSKGKTMLKQLLILICILSMTCVPIDVSAKGLKTNALLTPYAIEDEVFLGTVSRTPVTYALPPMIVNSTSHKIYLRIPRNNNLDLVQGTISMTPSAGGSGTSFNFTNYSGDNITVDVSSLVAGVYRVTLRAYAVGTSNTGTIYYKKYLGPF